MALYRALKLAQKFIVQLTPLIVWCRARLYKHLVYIHTQVTSIVGRKKHLLLTLLWLVTQFGDLAKLLLSQALVLFLTR